MQVSKVSLQQPHEVKQPLYYEDDHVYGIEKSPGHIARGILP